MVTVSLDATKKADANAPEKRETASLGRAEDARRHAARERRRKVSRFARRTLAVLFLAGSAAGVVVSLRPRPVPVDVGSVSRGPLVVSILESGVTRVKDRYVVSAPVSGSLSRVSLEPGDVVKEGDTI